MSRLDDAGMNRTDRNLKEAFASCHCDGKFPLSPHLLSLAYILSQRMIAYRKALVENKGTEVRMSFRDNPEHIVYLPLVPNGTGNYFCNRGIAQLILRIKHCFYSIKGMFFRILKYYINSISAAVIGFIPAKHCCQRVTASIGDDIHPSPKLLRFDGKLYTPGKEFIHYRAPPMTILTDS